jgi:hypothetical protein
MAIATALPAVSIFDVVAGAAELDEFCASSSIRLEPSKRISGRHDNVSTYVGQNNVPYFRDRSHIVE